MSTKIGDKTPAQAHNDLLYIPNENNGLDSTVRSVYSGNGIESPLKIGTGGIEANFGKGLLIKPLIDSCHYKCTDHGEISGSYQLSTTGGNIQKIKLVGSTTLSILSNLESSSAFELILIIEKGSLSSTLSFLDSSYKLDSDSGSLGLSSAIGAIDIVRFFTYNGGQTWLVYKDGPSFV